MSSDIVLTAALRQNLLSLQNTQSLIDKTQLRLATGLKVASALDGPQSFFTAQSLNNRASDLTRLLDGIGQSIRTIEAADNGITALTTLVEQAQSIVSSARDEIAASDGSARVVGNVDLRNVTSVVGLGTIVAGDVISITTTSDAGLAITENITIAAADSPFSLAARITDQFADNRAGEITARINDTTGFLEIESRGGRTFKIGDTTANPITLAGFTALGIGRYFEDETRNAATNTQATIVAGNTASSISLYEAAGNLVDAGDTIAGSTLTNDIGATVVANVAAGDTLNFVINNSGTLVSGTVALSGTWQDVVDQVNQTAAVNTLIRAEFDSNTGSISITSLSDSVENVGITFNGAAAGATRVFDLGWGDPTGLIDNLVATGAGAAETILAFNSSTQTLDQYANDFNEVRAQINDLVGDAQYRGVNLLNGDDLVTFFNEDNTSSLTTTGATFTAEGLGLTVANFSTSGSIETIAGRVRDALNEVRSFGSSLSNSLSIIQARQTFTQQTINTLESGADDLTVADQNEEGANLLALQTRQALGVTSLSLASQSQQSVLRLF